MKIPLNIDNNGSQSSRQAQAKVLERDLLATKKGDWNAKNNLIRTFTPLITTLARKRPLSENISLNTYIDAGKQGLLKAADKFKMSSGVDQFQFFALDFIEAQMDQVGQGKSGGFFSRLFGR